MEGLGVAWAQAVYGAERSSKCVLHGRIVDMTLTQKQVDKFLVDTALEMTSVDSLTLDEMDIEDMCAEAV